MCWSASTFSHLKLTKDDVVKVLTALQNASVVTDPHNPQIVKNGGPADITGVSSKTWRQVDKHCVYSRDSFDWRAVDFKAFWAPCATLANGVFGARWCLTKSRNLVGESERYPARRHPLRSIVGARRLATPAE